MEIQVGQFRPDDVARAKSNFRMGRSPSICGYRLFRTWSHIPGQFPLYIWGPEERV